MSETHRFPAPGKLNLMLRVVGRRADGYHLLQTVMRFIDYGDTLTFRVREDGVIARVNEVAGVPAGEDLALQASRLLQHLLVDPEGLARSRRSGERNPAFDLAARDLRDQGLAQHRLNRAQVVGQPELDVEIAVVDRAHLEAQRPVRELARCRGVSRHAVYHLNSVNRES